MKHRKMNDNGSVVRLRGYKKVQLIEFHDTGSIIGTKFHSEMVGWFPYNVEDLRVNADSLYAKVVDGVLSILFYLTGSQGDTIEQTLTYKGNFTAWWEDG